MIDLKARKKAAPILQPIARVLSKTGVTPTMVTVLGLAITVVGAALIANGLLWQGGMTAAFGVLLDALDGPLARYKGTSSDRGAFIDTMSDRFGEVAVWVGLGVYLRDDSVGLILCLVAMAFSLLIPYVRAKAESWGAEGRGGWMGRAERMLLCLIGVILAGFGLDVLEPMLWIFVVLTGLTVVQRTRRTLQQLPG
ncbi:MAG: CDP-alcohol phosphatidyltransferase family protein [Acidimicrobiia bacterium]